MARLALLDQGTATARRQLAQIRAALGDGPEAAALLGLAWALDVERSEHFPKEAELSASAWKKLAAPLHSAVELTEARRALVAGKMNVAREHVRVALLKAESPFMLATLGFLGLEAQSDALASDAVAQLQQLDSNDASAVVLRARASLMSGRIDESISMIEKIDDNEKPLSLPVQMRMIRAIAAYERLDLEVLRQVLAETEQSETPIPDLAALADAPKALTGKDLPSVTGLGQKWQLTAVWGDLIAVDIALAYGDVKQATTLTDKWTELDDRPLHLLRLAKLRRYEQRHLEAQELCERAAELAPVVPSLVIERTLALLSLNKARIAEEWLAKNTQLSEPARAWLRALISAHFKGGRAVAAAALEKLTLPDENTPLALRLVAARALVTAGDGRGTEFVGELARSIPNNPDVRWALTVMKK
jgi:tetratricopeptide (TPR) repeat protein